MQFSHVHQAAPNRTTLEFLNRTAVSRDGYATAWRVKHKCTGVKHCIHVSQEMFTQSPCDAYDNVDVENIVNLRRNSAQLSRKNNPAQRLRDITGKYVKSINNAYTNLMQYILRWYNGFRKEFFSTRGQCNGTNGEICHDRSIQIQEARTAVCLSSAYAAFMQRRCVTDR